MPPNLNNRLEQLEKEIYGLLTLQQQQCSDIQDLKKIHSDRPQGDSENESLEKATVFSKPCGKVKSEMSFGSNSTHCYNFQIKPDSFELKSPTSRLPQHKFQNVTPEDKIYEAQKVIGELKEELSYSKARICTMAKDMSLLTDALQSLRSKYKSIKIYRKDAVKQIEELKNINCDLCRKLDEEIRNNICSAQNAKQGHSAKLEGKVKEEVSKYFDQCKGQVKILKDTNEELVQNLQEMNNKYQRARSEIEDLNNELLRKDEESKMVKNRVHDNLEELLREEKRKNAIITKTLEKLETTVQNLMKTEKKSQQEMEKLKLQTEKLENENRECKELLKCDDRTKNNLMIENHGLKKRLSESHVEASAKIKKLENEMQMLRKQMLEKEKIVTDEKNTLKELVQELSEVVKKHKNRIKDLVQINNQQENMLQSQMSAFRDKEQELKVAGEHFHAVKMRNMELEEQIQTLRSSVSTIEKTNKEFKEKASEFKVQMKVLEKDLQNARHSMQEEQDKLLIKEKIIDDQADTIKKLKCNVGQQNEEVKRYNAEIAKLQKELEEEKFEKHQLQDTIEDIQWHKQQLQEQIMDLEGALKEKSLLPDKMDHHKKLLMSLENQVIMKQKEWELRCKLLSTEKKRAIQAAKFATQKLVDTVNDFQSHAESQKQVQTMLTNMVQSKNLELKCACKKISEFKDMMNKRDLSKSNSFESSITYSVTDFS